METTSESSGAASTLRVDLDSLMAVWRLHSPHAPRLTMHAVSQAIGVSENTLSGFRTGQRRNIDRLVLAKICGFFGCQPAAVLRFSTDGPLQIAALDHDPAPDHPGTVVCQLQALLDQRGLSIHAGAVLTGVAYPTVRRWALNEAQSYNLRHLAQACRAFDVGINDVLWYRPGRYEMGPTAC